MKKLLLIFIFSTFAFLLANVLDNDKTKKAWALLQEGGKVVFIRHALAPGNGDPEDFDLTNCSTQRNLDKVGIKQAKKIGEDFRKNQVPIEQVLTSEWCRCRDTAHQAFKDYEEFSALNSTYRYPYTKNEEKQIKALKKYVKNWEGKKGNLILVTHFSMITAVTSAFPSSGEIVITDKKFKVLDTIPTLE